MLAPLNSVRWLQVHRLIEVDLAGEKSRQEMGEHQTELWANKHNAFKTALRFLLQCCLVKFLLHAEISAVREKNHRIFEKL